MHSSLNSAQYRAVAQSADNINCNVLMAYASLNPRHPGLVTTLLEDEYAGTSMRYVVMDFRLKDDRPAAEQWEQAWTAEQAGGQRFPTLEQAFTAYAKDFRKSASHAVA